MPVPMLAVLSAPIIYSLVRWVIVSIGFGAAAYIGFDLLLQSARSMFEEQVSGLPELALAFLGIARFDIAINIIFSAYAVNLSAMILNRFILSPK